MQPGSDTASDLRVKAEPNAAGLLPGDDIIDSDLDDSDDEAQADADGQEDTAGMDIVFCVYDKVSGLALWCLSCRERYFHWRRRKSVSSLIMTRWRE